MKVLICEDDKQLAEMLKELLEEAHLEAVVARTMKEAKRLLDDTIKAITMDGQMPVQEGAMVSFTDMLVEDILKHRPDLAGRIFALAGNYENRDRLLLAGAMGVPGRREEDQTGTIKPYICPIVERLKQLAKEE